VEYKKGKTKEGIEDNVQLCAQAMCLEEMLATHIQNGYLFYGETHRRAEVDFDSELKSQVEKLSLEMHDIFRRGYTPKSKVTKKCNACSLKDICLPKLNKCVNVSRYIEERIGEADNK